MVVFNSVVVFWTIFTGQLLIMTIATYHWYFAVQCMCTAQPPRPTLLSHFHFIIERMKWRPGRPHSSAKPSARRLFWTNEDQRQKQGQGHWCQPGRLSAQVTWDSMQTSVYMQMSRPPVSFLEPKKKTYNPHHHHITTIIPQDSVWFSLQAGYWI